MSADPDGGGGEGRVITLADGARVRVRPIVPEDREALVRGFERLSPRSRYRRFFAPVARLRERELDYLTVVDHHDHEALVALDDESGEGVGVARFVRTGPEVAEPAVVVADDWQGQGVARALLSALVERAREEGVTSFVASVLAENQEAIGLLESLGQARRRQLGTEVELTIALPERETPGDVLLAALRGMATGSLAPARGVWARFGGRRRAAPGRTANAIVVGVTARDHAAVAVERAAGLAEALGARLHAVSAHRPLLDDRGAVESVLQASADDLRARGLRVEVHLRRGDAATALVDVAEIERAQLIVVGSRGRGAATSLLLGSVADSVAQRASCNVLIARPDAPG